MKGVHNAGTDGVLDALVRHAGIAAVGQVPERLAHAEDWADCNLDSARQRVGQGVGIQLDFVVGGVDGSDLFEEATTHILAAVISTLVLTPHQGQPGQEQWRSRTRNFVVTGGAGRKISPGIGVRFAVGATVRGRAGRRSLRAKPDVQTRVHCDTN